MTYKEELIGIFSDTYKSLNGFRPRFMMYELEAMSVEHIQEMLDGLQEQIQAEIRAEREAEEIRVKRIKKNQKKVCNKPFANLKEMLG